jgi:hypothetical protein
MSNAKANLVFTRPRDPRFAPDKGADATGSFLPVEIVAVRGMRAIALGCMNSLFVGSDAGGRAATLNYILIETAKLSGVDPQARLADALARLPDHEITRTHDPAALVLPAVPEVLGASIPTGVTG